MAVFLDDPDPFLFEKGLIERGDSLEEEEEEEEEEARLLNKGNSQDLKRNRVPTKPIPIPTLPLLIRLQRGILCIGKQSVVPKRN
jgi:hypothetical protein